MELGQDVLAQIGVDAAVVVVADMRLDVLEAGYPVQRAAAGEVVVQFEDGALHAVFRLHAGIVVADRIEVTADIAVRLAGESCPDRRRKTRHVAVNVATMVQMDVVELEEQLERIGGLHGEADTRAVVVFVARLGWIADRPGRVHEHVVKTVA